MSIDLSYLVNTMRRLIDTPSPVVYYDPIKPVIESYAVELGYTVTYDNRDTAYITVAGQDTSKTVCVSAHADTLGFEEPTKPSHRGRLFLWESSLPSCNPAVFVIY